MRRSCRPSDRDPAVRDVVVVPEGSGAEDRVLVAYLLAENPALRDTNDLYDNFLIDVEMGACMATSLPFWVTSWK